MAPLAVVKNLDVFLDRCPGMGTCFIMLVMCQFIFQAAPEALYGRLPFAKTLRMLSHKLGCSFISGLTQVEPAGPNGIR
jgi:hypothetical protein